MSASASLASSLKALPREKTYRYDEEVRREFLATLFKSLADGRAEYLRLFFPQGPPGEDEEWKLSEAQGAIDGAEYTEAARGKRCGHIFKHEEATYFCRTCTTDATCVLCQKCFEASNHEGHHVEVHLSEGSSGCCDCGDEEAWNRPLRCGIHTPLEDLQGDQSAGGIHGDKGKISSLPVELQESIRLTIGRVLDYMCDVFSCSPEHMRSPKHDHAILKDEELAHLWADWYGIAGEPEHCGEYALILWNDEKHTVDEVREQVARACRKSKTFGEQKAREIDSVGRAVIEYSRDLSDLIQKARILEQIKITVTIRSSRDYFREQMCDTIVEWLADISSCSVGTDHDILIDTVCSELLKEWHIGSKASNLSIGKQGLPDNQRNDDRLEKMRVRDLQNRMLVARQDARQTRLDIQLVVNNQQAIERFDIGPFLRREAADNEDNEDDDDEDDMENDEMNLDEALIQDPEEGEIDEGGLIVDTTQRTVVVDPDEAIATVPPRPPSSQSEESDADVCMLSSQNDPDELLSQTAMSTSPDKTQATPRYWLAPGKRTKANNSKEEVSLEENFEKRVRIDFLILYDLRMWKVLRNSLRRLYIGTVIKVPHFKRILGLRFAAIYKVLAQLYLVADREPDHSIINLSLQMLTTPSITAEIIERGNFCTRLLAILYTFLTKRRAGNPAEVDVRTGITFETGAMTNRRIHHFFQDLKYLLESKYTQERVRIDEEYLLQFLDLATLFQEIDPNKRAVGEHVQYESDSWVALILLIRDLARNIRMLAESFAWRKTQDPSSMCRALRQVAKTTTIHSIGGKRGQTTGSDESATGHVVHFKPVQPSSFEKWAPGYRESPHPVVDFVIENESMSFHHPLHWTLSWLIEQGKSMSREQLETLLRFDQQKLELKDPMSAYSAQVPSLEPLQYLLALFDIPLRTCAWLAQMKAGMWVRNGMALKHQMSTFRNFIQREVTSQRDIFLLQVGLVVCPPDTFLAAIIDRFGMSEWVNADLSIKDGWEDHQQLDVAEEFVHLLIVLLSDRTLLRPIEEDSEPILTLAKREMIHSLCFKPLSYSDLVDRMTHTTTSMPNFNETLFQVAQYKAPEGLSDTGSFELRDECFAEVDPYNYFYSKNQREESENAWRRQRAKETSVSFDDTVYEPQITRIKSGLFVNIGNFTQTPLFGQIIWGLLHLALHPNSVGGLPAAKIEGFLPTVLHLTLIAIIEDTSKDVKTLSPYDKSNAAESFIDLAIATPGGNSTGEQTILHQLILLRDMQDVHEAAKPKIRKILQYLQEKRPLSVERKAREFGLSVEDSASDASKEMAAQEQAEKKRKAEERNARVMASFKQQQSDFMSHQMNDFDLDEWSDVGSDVEMSDDHVKKTWNFPKDTCIYCQEETDEDQLYGSLAFLASSKIFRESDLQNVEHLQEVGMTPLSYDRDVEGLRPFGVARQNVEQVLRVSESGTVIAHERRGLGKGWPPSQNCRSNVATGCGHLMHYSCFATFNAATERRHMFQIARNHPERLHLREFVCPLCKALGNAFLPIIFKPKILSNPSELFVGSFDVWLQVQVPSLISESRLATDDTYQLEALTTASMSNTARFQSARSSFRSETNSTPSRGGPTDHSVDPSHAYARLKDTLLKNNMDPRNSLNESNEYSPADILAGALGSSISATEISFRGQDSGSDSLLLLDKIPNQILSHLRILSETCATCASYLPMGGSSGIKVAARIEKAQLFGPVFDSPFANFNEKSQDLSMIPPLLYEDSFEFLTRYTFSLGLCMKHENPQHIIRLVLLVEIAKVILAFLENYGSINTYSHANISLRTDTQGGESEKVKLDCTHEQAERFSIFTQGIIDILGQPLSEPNTDIEFLSNEMRNPNNRSQFEHFLRASILSYILPFLRKCVLLLHVRASVDFSSVVGISPQLPEVDRLTQILGLPALDSLVDDCISPNQPFSTRIQELLTHWITHWRLHRRKPFQKLTDLQRRLISRNQDDLLRGIFSPGNVSSVSADTDASLPGLPGSYFNDPQSTFELDRHLHPNALETPRPLRLPHPGVYELVALPNTHDILNAEALSRRCPTTKGPLTDPCLCLFCGDVFCGQADCCSVEAPPGSGSKQGGCFLHQGRCGGNIGMFLDIRRNTVVFLNGKHGCFLNAPYLDEHGETDMGLKRRGRLFLERRRYDRLFRDVWLGHGLPSAVSRKLEGEVNTGGWETL